MSDALRDILAEPRLARVLTVLTDAGHTALVVGGAVRNALMGQLVADVDIATDAHPDIVSALAAAAGLGVVPTGIEHGTVTVIADGRPFEVTTFRRDVETFGRHARVVFGDSLEADAARRDFTMNALYATPGGEVLDPVAGLPDLRAGRVRFVGAARDRIAEDVLRILRFFRFHAWYGRRGGTDAEALAACAALAGSLGALSRERVGAEMRKLLAAPDPLEAVTLMAETGVLAQLLPGADPAGLAALMAVEGDAAPDWTRRLAALGGQDAAARLRLSRAEAARLAVLAQAGPDLSLDGAGYRHGAALGCDVALVGAARGLDLPPDWRARIDHAAAAKLPIAARDLPQLEGLALGRGLKAAEAAWIASGFASPVSDLVAAALRAGEGG